MGLNNLLCDCNIHAAFETMIASLKRTSPLFEKYLNECSEVCNFVTIKSELFHWCEVAMYITILLYFSQIPIVIDYKYWVD